MYNKQKCNLMAALLCDKSLLLVFKHGMNGALKWGWNGMETVQRGDGRRDNVAEVKWEAGLRREVKCWDAKVICAEEELLNGVFWSFKWDTNSQLLVGWNDCVLTERETKGDEWVSTAYRLPSDIAVCVYVVWYTHTSLRGQLCQAHCRG